MIVDDLATIRESIMRTPWALGPGPELSENHRCDAASEITNKILGAVDSGTRGQAEPLGASIPSAVQGRESDNGRSEGIVQTSIEGEYEAWSFLVCDGSDRQNIEREA